MNLLKIKNNQSGIVFVTVLVIIIVMMVLTVSIISMNVTQVQVAEVEVKRIEAEMWAQGTLNYFHADQQLPTPTDAVTTLPDFTMGTSNTFHGFTPAGTYLAGAGFNQTNKFTVNVTY